MIETISFDEYRRRPGLSSGFIRDMLRSPMHAKHKRDNDDKDTSALAFGRYVHAAILEPMTIMQRFILKPDDLDRKTKAGREEYAKLLETGKQIVTTSEVERAVKMKSFIFAHKSARDFLSDVAPDNVEQSAFWQQGSHECKARFDHLSRRGAIVDIKTTTDASKRAFGQSIAKYGYAVQACHYLNGAMANGLKVNQFVIVAVESEAPHAVAVYRIDQGYIDAAQDQIESAFAMYRQCLKTGNWNGYPEEIQDVLCPAWMCVEEVS